MVRTVQRAIESRQAKLDKKHGKISVFDLQSRMDELLEKGEITVGGRQTCSVTDPTWEFYMMWNQVVNIFNKYEKEYTIKVEHVHIDKPGGAFSGGYWQENKYTLLKK